MDCAAAEKLAAKAKAKRKSFFIVLLYLNICIIYVNLTQIYKELEKGQNKKPFFSFFKIVGRMVTGEKGHVR
jgi:hypothetical protein